MQTSRGAVWLKVNLWVGAVFDASVLLPMLSPKVAQSLFGIADRSADPGFRYAMFVGASLMAGWTCLLVWAAQRPMERRAIALMTLVPVLAGLLLSSLYAIASGLVAWERMLPTVVLQTALGVSYLGSYVATGRAGTGLAHDRSDQMQQRVPPGRQ